MANVQALTHPDIPDRDALQEFSEALADYLPNIERDMARLAREPGNRALVADIFRALHNIKGDAALCRVETAILIAHPLESLLTRLRSGELSYSPLLGELILLALDRLEFATEALIAGRPIDHLRLPALVDGLEHLSAAGSVDDGAAALIEAVTGFRAQAALHKGDGPRMSVSGPAEDSPSDLRFFHELARQFEARSSLFSGRIDRLLHIVRDTNQAAGSPLDAEQLEAAVCMHDVGMMFLPEAVWLKVGRLTEEERQALHKHPDLGAELLARMPGWQGAAQMVRQHHEQWEGGGYPAGVSGDAICAGAKLLAIVDAFEAVMLKQGARGDRRSMLRAIAEVNACDRQFAPEWVGPFNAVMRRMLDA